MRVMVPLADGFEEIEALTVVDVLRRADIETHTVGVIGSVMTGANGIRVMVDRRLNEISPSDYEAIVLPGGSPGYENLGRSAKLMDIVKQFHNQNKIVAAICAAPLLLAKEGILDDKKATVYPGNERSLPYPRDRPVIVDGNIITSQGPGTAMEFALQIVKRLKDDATVMRLRRDLVVKDV